MKEIITLKGRGDKTPNFIRKVKLDEPTETINEKGFARVGHIFCWFGRYLSQEAKVVYMTMKCFAPPDRTTHGYADWEDRPIAQVSYSELANVTNVRRPSVINAVAELIEFGWVEKLETDNTGFKTRNKYYAGSDIYFRYRYEDGTSQPVCSPTKKQALEWKRLTKRKETSAYAKSTNDGTHVAPSKHTYDGTHVVTSEGVAMVHTW